MRDVTAFLVIIVGSIAIFGVVWVAPTYAALKMVGLFE